jgi:hypothetical protein
LTSQIDETVPVQGSPTTQSVRDNFATAKTEISALQSSLGPAPFLPLAGAHMTGPMYLYNDPTDGRMPATKDYVDSHGTGGGGGIPEAPTDGATYGRHIGAWNAALPIAGGTLTGPLILNAPPTAALGAAVKQDVDAKVMRAGDTMGGPLVLAADPTAALGAVTKQYTDAADGLRAPIASPTFTGTVATASRLIMSGPSGPALTLYDTTAGRPVFGVYNTAGLLSFGLATPSNGNPNGNPFVTIDQNGNAAFTGRVTPLGGIVGVADGSNAAAGQVGEYLTATVNSPGNGIGSNIWSNVTALALTAGDWDVSGIISFNPSGGPVYTWIAGSVSTTPANANPVAGTGFFLVGGLSSGLQTMQAGCGRVSLAAAQSIYLVANCNYTGGSISIYGSIQARRVR